MVPGWAGVDMLVTANVRAVPDPQLFDAVTEMFPDTVPVVTVMVFVVEEPVQPDGNVHV